MKKSQLSIVAALVAAAALPTWADQKCGNDCQGGPEKCGDCKTGANPFAVYSGSVQREITDLEFFSGIGEDKLTFKRTTTSRYRPGIPTPFGAGGSWRHSYYWNIVPSGTDANGNEIIHIDYPDGKEYDFHKTTPSDLFLTAVSGTLERIEQTTSDANQYYLWFPDGHRLAFHKVSGTSTTFTQQGVYDKYNNLYSFTWDSTKQRVTDITEPGGRYLHLNYGYIGNFNQTTTTFVYRNTTATSVTVLGDFNHWGSPSGNPMVKGSDGLWRATVTVQPQTAYQYKFLVNGSVWVSDPNNPNTVPAGGPSTGNNSVVTVSNADLGTTSASVPVTFSYTSSTATSVTVAGGFNGWNGSTNSLTRSGNTWTTTLSLPQGIYDYKFVINTSSWQQDPGNPYADPDGYGGYNSRLAVGPYDDAITQVTSSDGRSVAYGYSMYGVAGTLYSTLTRVSYGDSTQALYAYNAPSIGSRPMLTTADDPRYKGPLTRVAYTYQDNGIEGFVATEAGLTDGTVLASLAPSTTGDRSVTMGGRTITTTFDQGNLSSETNSLGRKQTYTYFNDGWGMMSSSTEWNGTTPYTTSYSLTAQFGNLAQITLPDGKTRIIQYADNNKPFFAANRTDENGHVTTYTRDSNHRPTRIDYADGSYETFTYDNNNFGLLTNHRFRNGYSESFTYYGASDTGGKKGDLKSKTDAAGYLTEYTFDGAGRMLTKKIYTYIPQTTTYVYNDRGQVTGITFADNSTQAFGYDNYGNQTSITNELTKTSTKSYDQYNRVTDDTDPLSHNTHFVYGDPQGGGGNCSCNFQNYPTSITQPSGKSTSIAYNSEWEKTSVSTGSGSEATTTIYQYDGIGNVSDVTDGRSKTWHYDYNNRKRLAKKTDPNGNYTEWTYDGVGNKMTEKRSGDTTGTSYTYNAGDYLTDIVDQAGNHTHMAVDGAGNRITIVDPNGHTNSLGYDGLNRKTSLSYPDGTAEGCSYDAAGNVSYCYSRSSQTEAISYDQRNREISTSWIDCCSGTTKSYDSAGRLLTFLGDASSLSYTYDDANRLTSETQQITSDSGPKTVSYAYDADGNRTSITYPSGSTATLGYSSRNQLNSIVSGAITATYVYDGNGSPLSKTLGSGVTTNFTYDNAGRVQTIDNLKNSVSFDRLDYSYNNVNDRTGRTETINGTGKLDSYGHDPIDQLTSVKYNYNASSNTQDRLVSYNYDATGNRYGASGVSDSVNGNTNYVSNSVNEYTTAGSLVPTYYSSGNLHAQGTWTYEYDWFNRLTHAYTSGTDVTLAYDGRNRCVSRTVNGATTFLYYDGWKLIEEHNASDALIARYVTGIKMDDWIARIVGTSIYYYSQDAMASVVSLTDSSGNVAERYAYDAFGTPTFKDGAGNVVTSSASGNRFLFTGREYIQPMMQYDYRNRVYSPALGRFLQTDPVRFQAGDYNLYRYVANDPTLRRDPMGLDYHGALDRQEFWWDFLKIGPYYGLELRRTNRWAFDKASASGLPGDQDGPQDAYRHCIFSCQSTKKMGEEYTKFVTDEHEDADDRNQTQSKEERQMDEANNAAGRKCGKNKKDNRSCEDQCASLLSSGNLFGPGGAPMR